VLTRGFGQGRCLFTTLSLWMTNLMPCFSGVICVTSAGVRVYAYIPTNAKKNGSHLN
jgi:hypothetical protein